MGQSFAGRGMDNKRYFPSPTIGEYVQAKPRPLAGGLYPLEAEGTYGVVPKKEYLGKWSEPEPYVRREKKPKLYSSYSISDKCELHSLVQDKYSRGCRVHSTSPTPPVPPTRTPRGSRAGSAEEEIVTMKRPSIVETKITMKSPVPSFTSEELGMTSKLLLARELEEDIRGALKAGFDDKDMEYKDSKKESLLETERFAQDDFESSYVI